MVTFGAMKTAVSDDPFGLPADRRPQLYIVRWPVYRAWLELAGTGFDGRNPDWDGVLHEKIVNAKVEDEALLLTQVWVFGLHYGLNKRDSVEIDGNIFREPEVREPSSPLYVPDDAFERVDIAELARAGKTQVLNVNIPAGPK